MASIKKVPFAEQLTQRMTPYMEEATKSVSEKAREHMDKYFESVKPFNHSLLDVRDNLDEIKEDVKFLSQGSTNPKKGLNIKDVIDIINELSGEIESFITKLSSTDEEQPSNEREEGVSDQNDAQSTESSNEVEVEVSEGTITQEVQKDADAFSGTLEETFKRKDKVDLQRSNSVLNAVNSLKKDSGTIFDKIISFILLALGVFTYWEQIKSSLNSIKKEILEAIASIWNDSPLREGAEEAADMGETVIETKENAGELINEYVESKIESGGSKVGWKALGALGKVGAFAQSNSEEFNIYKGRVAAQQASSQKINVEVPVSSTGTPLLRENIQDKLDSGRSFTGNYIEYYSPQYAPNYQVADKFLRGSVSTPEMPAHVSLPSVGVVANPNNSGMSKPNQTVYNNSSTYISKYYVNNTKGELTGF